MTTDEYLKTCSNVPQLPRSWRWVVQDSEYISPKTERKYTKVSIYILDEEEHIRGKATDIFSHKWLPNLIKNGGADAMISKLFYNAYNTLYRDTRVSFCEVLGIDPSL